MELKWMGRYRNLVRSLVYYSNSSNKFTKNSGATYHLTQYQYQILEYICEHEDENKIMSDIARDLGILKSIVTSETRELCNKGFVSRHYMPGNRKSIILKPTEEGKQAYISCYAIVEKAFERFFKALDNMSDEDLKTFAGAVDSLSDAWNAPLEHELEETD